MKKDQSIAVLLMIAAVGSLGGLFYPTPVETISSSTRYVTLQATESYTRYEGHIIGQVRGPPYWSLYGVIIYMEVYITEVEIINGQTVTPNLIVYPPLTTVSPAATVVWTIPAYTFQGVPTTVSAVTFTSTNPAQAVLFCDSWVSDTTVYNSELGSPFSPYTGQCFVNINTYTFSTSAVTVPQATSSFTSTATLTSSQPFALANPQFGNIGLGLVILILLASTLLLVRTKLKTTQGK